jgi:hypothetical protein
MSEDALDQVLRLVVEGRLTAAEAEPILAALDERDGKTRPRAGDPRREIRFEVREGRRVVVNLRLPISLGRYALDRIPGLSADQVRRVREALDAGITGPVVTVDDERGGVRIVIE